MLVEAIFISRTERQPHSANRKYDSNGLDAESLGDRSNHECPGWVITGRQELVPGTSGVGGKSAVIRSNSDIGIGMSGVGGNPDVAPTWPARPEIARSGHKPSHFFLCLACHSRARRLASAIHTAPERSTSEPAAPGLARRDRLYRRPAKERSNNQRLRPSYTGKPRSGGAFSLSEIMILSFSASEPLNCVIEGIILS